MSVGQAFGQNLPPELKWKLGKTAPSIAFVQSAEHHMAGEKCTPSEAERLRDAIKKIKGGNMVLQHTVTIEEFLRS